MTIKDQIQIQKCKSLSEVKRIASLKNIDVEKALEVWKLVNKKEELS